MQRHWTDDERALLVHAKTMHDLAHIAERVLERMPQPIHQVCGPLSTGGLGCLRQNAARFEYAVHELDRRGYSVFNQMLFQDRMTEILPEVPADGEYHWEILTVFYERIFQSGRVRQLWFIPGRDSSRGTCWEQRRTQTLGITQVDYPYEWLQHFEPVPCSCETCCASV